jgi:hypothetical protein
MIGVVVPIVTHIMANRSHNETEEVKFVKIEYLSELALG